MAIWQSRARATGGTPPCPAWTCCGPSGVVPPSSGAAGDYWAEILVTHRYSRHAHETFTLGLIEAGVEQFEYGGSLLRAGRGGVALLNPEVVGCGRAAAPAR